MKRLFIMLIILFGFYLALEYSFKIFGPGHEITYEINSENNTLTIEETYTARKKNDLNNYYFKVTINETPFYYQTYHDFKNYDKVITDVKYFKNDKYTCILPIFIKETILFDIKCFDGNEYYFYNSIRGESKSLDEYVETINVKNYSYVQFLPTTGDSIKESHFEFYFDNVLSNNYLGLTTYKGLYVVGGGKNDNLDFIPLFTKDVYEQNISSYADKYYVVANYNTEYSFNKFLVVDLTTRKVENLNSRHEISFDSYFQGKVGNRLYLLDRSNKKQFEVDLKTFTVIEYGNVDSGVRIFSNGKWVVEPMSKAISENLIFNNEYEIERNEEPYYRIDKVGGKTSGYYYYYERKDNKDYVYRSEIKNKDEKTFLFESEKVSDIVYHNDYVYFYNGNDISYYHDSVGIKPLVTNEEYEFNKSLKYSLYIK